MSTATATPTLDISGTERVPFSRLVKVEARKMTDTRAGFWLMLITGVLIVLAMAITLLVVLLNDLEITADTFGQIMTIPLSLLVPVFAITAVTSEWSQRTALTTFALESHRTRVVGAKLVTVVGLALATIALAIVFGAIGNLLYGAMSGNDVVWNIDLSVFAWLVIQQLLFFLMAFAFGMLILNTPGAVAAYYVVALLLPLMVYGILYAIFDWAKDTIPWIDLSYALAPYIGQDPTVGDPTTTSAFQVLSATTLWVVIPMVLGTRRILRAEVK